MTTTNSPPAIQASRLRREALGVPDEKARHAIQRDIVIEKINLFLLPLMRKHDIDMWITLDATANTTRTRLPTRSAVRGVCAMPTFSLIRATAWRRSSSSRTHHVRTWRRGSTTR